MVILSHPANKRLVYRQSTTICEVCQLCFAKCDPGLLTIVPEQPGVQVQTEQLEELEQLDAPKVQYVVQLSKLDRIKLFT